MSSSDLVLSPSQPQSLHSSLDSQQQAPGYLQAEAIRKVAKMTENEIESMYNTYSGQFNPAKSAEHGDVIRLKQELNKVVVDCARKTELLRRLQEMSEYPLEPNAYTAVEINDVNVHLHPATLEVYYSQLQVQLQATTLKTIQEDQTTEMLKQMFEKITKTWMIMKQRATEVQSIYQKVEHQLSLAKRMRQIADNYLSVANSQTTDMKGQIQLAREKFREQYEKKTKGKDQLQRTRRKSITRMSIASYSKTELTKRTFSLHQSLDFEFQRHITEKKKLEQATKDISAFLKGFQVIAEVLQRRGCFIEYQNGVSTETIQALTSQFSLMMVFEDSLASKHNELTWEFNKKSTQLSNLVQELVELKSRPETSGSPHFALVQCSPETVEHLENLSLQLYAGLIGLLHIFELVHQRVSECALDSESPGTTNWEAIRTLTRGFRLKRRDILHPASTSSLDAFRSKKPRPKVLSRGRPSVTEESEDTRDLFTAEVMSYIPIGTAEFKALLDEAKIDFEEGDRDSVVATYRKLQVVKYFADVSIIKEFLQLMEGRGSFQFDWLIEKSHQAMRNGLKSIINFATEAVLSFVKSVETGKESVFSFYQQREQPPDTRAMSRASAVDGSPRLGKKQKDQLRLRFSTLFAQYADEEEVVYPQKIVAAEHPKLPNAIDDTLEADKRELEVDKETAENQYMTEARVQLKSQSNPMSNRRLEGTRSTGRIRKLQQLDDTPMMERAKSLLKDYLNTERKITEVKIAERVMLTARSARLSPARYTRFHAPFHITTNSAFVRKPYHSDLRPKLFPGTHFHSRSTVSLKNQSLH